MSGKEIIAGAAALLVAALVVWRRRRFGFEKSAIGLLVAAALGLYASGVLSALPDPKTAIGDIAKTLGPWTYALVGALAYLETGAFIGLVAPGETVVIAGGVIAGQGEIDLVPLIGLVWVCAILGDTTSFFIGRRLGRGFLIKRGTRLGITRERLEQVESYFERHGGKTILVGRFIGLVRALAPFIAGSSGLAYVRFIPFSIVGTALWAATFSLLGYIFWQSFDQVAHVAGQATFAFGVVVAVIVGVVYSYRRFRKPEERRRLVRWVERQEQKPYLRPLFWILRPLWRYLVRPIAVVLAPQVRFLWDRLTPGGLGLELTTALAVAAGGLYVFFLYVVTLAGDPGLTPFDRETLDLADSLRVGAAVDVAKIVTELGAAPIAAGAVVATAGFLAARRHPYELFALLAGAILVYVGVQLAKAGVDRPRPDRPLVSAAKSSYPSGHAAYATAWIACGVALGRVLPGLASRATLVFAGIAVAAAVGLTRIYLRVHYWSDVAGGWALGVGAFGLCALVALIVAFVRQNGDSAEAAPAVAEQR